MINTSVSSSVSTDIQALTTEFYENYIKKLNPGMTLFKKNGTEVIDGASAAVYEMNMDDAAFKALIKYLGNDFFTNAESRTLIKNYFIAIYDLMAEISPMYGMVSDEFEKGFAELEANLDKSHESFNKFMDIMNDVKIVGDKGFTLKYSINPDGYIVKETSYIDLVIDLEKWTAAGAELETAFGGIKTQEEAKAVQVQEEPIAEPAAIEPAEASLPAQTAEEASSETPEEADFSTSYAVTSAIPSGIINLGIEYETVLSNINGQVEIEFPELTEENSIDYFEMLKQMMSSVQNNTSTISVYVNDSKVQFMNDPIIRNGRTLAPAREVFESLNGDVQWDDTNRTVKAVIGDTKIDLTIDSNEAFVNGVLHVLDEPASIIDDRTYVPVRFLAESIGGQVEWYPEAMTVFIVK